jgi:hypothetical protein
LFRKPTSKAALWMMISAPAQVLHQFVGDGGELRLVAQEFVADAVDLERVLVRVALRVQVEVLVVAGQLAGHQFHAADLDDAVAGFGRQARGFGVEDDLAHRRDYATRRCATQSLGGGTGCRRRDRRIAGVQRLFAQVRPHGRSTSW